MRIIIPLVGLFASSSALACGMYIPQDLKVASLGSLMEEIDEEEAKPVVAAVKPAVEKKPVVVAAEPVVADTPAVAALIPEVVEFEAAPVLITPVRSAAEARQDRKAARRGKRQAPNT